MRSVADFDEFVFDSQQQAQIETDADLCLKEAAARGFPLVAGQVLFRCGRPALRLQGNIEEVGYDSGGNQDHSEGE